MARGVNKIIIVGNIGQEPEKVDGKQITKISVATTEKWKDKQSGEMQEKTEWHRVTFFGHLANSAMKYLYKGAKVYIEGKNSTHKWADQGGTDHYTTEIHVREYLLLSDVKDDGNNQQQNNSAPQQQQQQSQQASSGADNDFDSDIPF